MKNEIIDKLNNAVLLVGLGGFDASSGVDDADDYLGFRYFNIIEE